MFLSDLTDETNCVHHHGLNILRLYVSLQQKVNVSAATDEFIALVVGPIYRIRNSEELHISYVKDILLEVFCLQWNWSQCYL